MNVLNITNGDCAVRVMKQAGIVGEYLPWRDVLHDGPVPEKLSLKALSRVRAQFIFEQGWGKEEAIKQSFIERDNTLKVAGSYSKVILWFEHDLYDQLQLIQLLDWFNHHALIHTELSLICTKQYLGPLSPEALKGLYPYEKPVTDVQLQLASTAWQAFRADSPLPWHDLLSMDTRALPFLKGAVVRLLEEYPSFKNGLSRTASQALRIIAEGKITAMEAFVRNQTMEERVYLGDVSFWVVLRALLNAEPPLLKLSKGEDLTPKPDSDQVLMITQTGQEVLKGEKNGLKLINQERYLGGVCLNAETPWCWDSDSNALINDIY